MPAFLDEVISPFCQSEPTVKGSLAFGRFLWVHAYYPHQQLEVWRPRTFDPTTSSAIDFNPELTPSDAFRKPLPYGTPHLKTDEEFLVLRSKRRPAVLIAAHDPQLDAIPKGHYRGKIARHLCTVALVYSAADNAGTSKFPPPFIGRVRQLGYPQFMFIPKRPPLYLDSLLRLDAVQSVAVNHLDPMGLRLSKDAEDILRSQLCFYQTGLAPETLSQWREELIRQ